ncbi:hypothetical protein [Dyadobacter sediminis]|uniref:Uncharacterized protein n=1 Tax=Dyadobacter sediminis TaxID=1493691 RepID=A0A5R9KN52_9BACT|nr:hypothetical protein [Dyadobacter sediminis]TLU97466.1 hypothetical protein FEM55_00395 [Dyadobacter sediminis]GGC16109.1 hypothetical protein GCM10011325_48640 [Dyadobacter sediminis]
MSDFISLAEAASRTGKSEMTIRRLTKKDGSKRHVSHRNGVILIRAEFVNSIYPFLDNHVNIDNKNVSYVNKSVSVHQVESEDFKNNRIAILETKVEGQAALLESKQHYITFLEKQFQEYKDEKQKELDRLHERWSQEQEIFKRDQHLNAGKYMIQQNQELPESIDNEEKKSLWKRIFK